jgi:hypothetical protein
MGVLVRSRRPAASSARRRGLGGLVVASGFFSRRHITTTYSTGGTITPGVRYTDQRHCL